MAVPKEWLTFLREQFPEGSRIKLREMNSGADAPPPGSTGTLDRITDDAGFCVTWQDGRHTELTLGTDSFSVGNSAPPISFPHSLFVGAISAPRDRYGHPKIFGIGGTTNEKNSARLASSIDGNSHTV